MSSLKELLSNIILKVNSSVKTEAQELTEEQKAQVRENIGAAVQGDAYILSNEDKAEITAQVLDMVAYIQPDAPPEDAPENSLWVDTDAEIESIMRAEGVGF